LVYPDIENKLIQGQLNTYREGGWLSQWSSPGYRESMTGTHSDCVIADAYLRGVTDYSVQTALDAVLKDAMQAPDSKCSGGTKCGRYGWQELQDHGYIPIDGTYGSSTSKNVTNSLDFAYDNTCIANMASSLIKNKNRYVTSSKQELASIVKDMHSQATGIVDNLYDTDTSYDVTYPDGTTAPLKGFFHGKQSNGDWYSPENVYGNLSKLYMWLYGYVEGSPWQYMFNMQYDMPELAKKIASANDMTDSKKALENQLDKMLQSTHAYNSQWYGHEQEEMTYLGLGQFGINNQPSWGFEYGYVYTDAPWKTQCLLRNIMDPERDKTHQNYNCFGDDERSFGTLNPVHSLFFDAEDGLSGDEDNGSMFAWYLINSMGLNLLPGTDTIQFGSPLFNQVTVRVPAYGTHPAKTLTIHAPNNSPDKIYVKKIMLNGKPLNNLSASNYSISQKALFESSNDASITFIMSDKPIKS